MSAAFTVRMNVVVRLAVLGLVPVTVIVEMLVVVPGAALMVSVVLQVGLQEATENAAVTPAGSADSENVTAWVVPASSVAVMVVEPGAPPAVTFTVSGLAANE